MSIYHSIMIIIYPYLSIHYVDRLVSCRFFYYQHPRYANRLFISLVNQVNHHLHHHIFLLSLTLSNHESESHEGVIGKAFGAIGAVKNTVTIEKPKE